MDVMCDDSVVVDNWVNIDWRLMDNHWWFMYNNWILMIDHWSSMNNYRLSVNHNVRPMYNIWRLWDNKIRTMYHGLVVVGMMTIVSKST